MGLSIWYKIIIDISFRLELLDDSLKENPKDESFETVNTFEEPEPEVVVKEQEKSEQDESIDRNKTILLGEK